MKKCQKYNKGALSHGMSYTRFYGVWRNMNARCKSKRLREYNFYAKKGIKVIWGSFQEFKNDMYVSYLKHVKEFGENNTSIDRIDSDSNYCKENCRWATSKVQSNNMRRNRWIIFNGERLTLAQWCRKLNTNKGTLGYRIKILGLNKALNSFICV